MTESAKAELRAIALSICEGIWLKRMLIGLKVPLDNSIRMYCDNQAAVHHDQTLHVEIGRHIIKDKVEGGIVSLYYIPSSQQTVEDIFMKALPRTFDKFLSKLGMFNI